MAGNWNPCGVGAAAEMRFAAAASERGIAISLPWGHAHGYDLITDYDGSLCRVQVKASAYRVTRDRYDADVRHQGEFDVLAVVAGSTVYLFPRDLISTRASLVLRPPGCRDRGKSGPAALFDPEDWREAWHTLKGGQ